MVDMETVICHLRGRFVKNKGKIPFDTLAKSIGVSGTTLKHFMQGREVRERALRNIEAWCDQQESATPRS